jgi:peptide chain release factor subunit 1
VITADAVNRILRFKGQGLPVVSLYARVPCQPQRRVVSLRSEVDSQLHAIRPMARDRSLGHDAMMSIRGDIDRIMDVAGQERWPPGAVALFSCSGRGFFEEVILPRQVRERVVVDETPYVRPMLAMLDEYHRCCVVAVDREGARLWELYGDEMQERGALSVSAKPGRNPNKLEELTKRHFREVITTIDNFYRGGEFELLIVGGHRPELPRFLGLLTHELRGALAGTFPVEDDARISFGEIKRQAIAIVDGYERAEEERMVAEVVEMSAAEGLAVLGLAPCLWAGSVSAINRLLVQDGAIAPGVICDRNHWLALAGDTCPLCDRPVRPAPDVIDELVQVVIDDGGAIKHVSAHTVLTECVAAASLRFPLPPNP